MCVLGNLYNAYQRTFRGLHSSGHEQVSRPIETAAVGLSVAKQFVYFRSNSIVGLYRKRIVIVGRGGSLVDSSPFARRVVGSNPALAVT